MTTSPGKQSRGYLLEDTPETKRIERMSEGAYALLERFRREDAFDPS